MTVGLIVDGADVEVDGDTNLLVALREQLGITAPKDGCSPQGQCGCCTVLVDGQPRVACVTPARRVAGRAITTLEGLDEGERDRWLEAFTACGASQCGFCTPGIIVRLEGLRRRETEPDDEAAVERALAAHLCRCTGWRTILDAWHTARRPGGIPRTDRDLAAAGRRARLEGGTPQSVGPEVAAGRAGFADDTAPRDALVAVPDGKGGWSIGESLAEARAGKIQGRRSSLAATPPLETPPGDWDLSLRTSWVEPAYLETDASWCLPGGEPASPLAGGGAFGAKLHSPAPEVARRLADETGRAVRVLLSREDVVRMGPKRPPVAVGIRADGTGVIRVVATPGIAEAIAAGAPEVTIEEVAVPGPPTSADIRGAGWLEAAVASAAATGQNVIRSPEGAAAAAEITAGGAVAVRVACGDPLDQIVLASYCVGAAHMALGMVTSEALAVGDDGEVHDLTIRSFGIPPASATPEVTIELDGDLGDVTGPAVPASNAVSAAVALAVWRQQGLPGAWPTRVPLRVN